MDYEITVKPIPARPLAVESFRTTATDLPRHLKQAFGNVMAYLSSTDAEPEGPAIAIYEWQDGNGEFEVRAGFVVARPIEGDDHVVPAELPMGEAVTTTHVGPYETMQPAYEAVQAWIRTNGRDTAGNVMWEEYFSGPGTAPEQTRTEIYWPLK